MAPNSDKVAEAMSARAAESEKIAAQNKVLCPLHSRVRLPDLMPPVLSAVVLYPLTISFVLAELGRRPDIAPHR